MSIGTGNGSGRWVANSDMHPETNIYGRRHRYSGPNGMREGVGFPHLSVEVRQIDNLEWFFPEPETIIGVREGPAGMVEALLALIKKPFRAKHLKDSMDRGKAKQPLNTGEKQ